MKRIIKYLVSIFFVIFLVTFGIYQFFPSILDKFNQIQIYKKANLTLKTANVDGDIFEYLEGGEGDTIVLLHGFQSDKKSLVRYGAFLNKNFHVIIPDFSGHGGSSYHKDQRYDLVSLAKDLNRFIEKLNISTFHFMGTSMGGGVALHYTLLYPEKVKKICLVNPLGVLPPVNSYFQDCLAKGKNLMLPLTLADFDELARICIGKPFPVNNHFKKYALNLFLQKRDFFKTAFDQLVLSNTIDPDLFKIKNPTLIVASKKDLVLHYTSYEVFHKNLPNSKFFSLEEGTHVLIDDNFRKARKEIENFY